MNTRKLEYIEIYNYLKELNPNPKCELNYNKDYEFLISVMLSAQTTDKRVNQVTKVLFDRYNNLNLLSKADIKDIENIVRPLGSYTKKSKAVIDIANRLLDLGYFPNDRETLESFPMVGRKTANVVLGELYRVPNIAVDTHVERVSKRLGLARKNADVLEVERSLKRKFPKDKWVSLHLRLVHFGRYYCKAKNPLCEDCKLKSICKYKKTAN